MSKRKTVLFGGTFDPIHLGHTTVAQAAIEQIGAEKMLFIPAMRSPLKKTLPKGSDHDRLAMITSAIEGLEKFEVSDYELKGTDPSYTLDTIRHFQEEYGSDTLLYWLAGADSIIELEFWYGINELIDQYNLCVMYRAGFEKPDFGKLSSTLGFERVAKLKKNIIKTPLVDISSTEIRRRLAVGDDISNMVHPGVAEYIKQHRLYESK
jgi:nicotinate-nucleotide adenylyltransferase